jgi:hypothetical protein
VCIIGIVVWSSVIDSIFLSERVSSPLIETFHQEKNSVEDYYLHYLTYECRLSHSFPLKTTSANECLFSSSPTYPLMLEEPPLLVHPNNSIH